MRYYKVVKDNYITSIGTGDIGVEVSEAEYVDLKQAILNKPFEHGYTYMLLADGTWERKIVEQIETEEEIKSRFVDEIMNSISVSDKPNMPPKKGYKWERHYDADSHTIMFIEVPDTDYIPDDDGTYTRPITFVSGMAVRAGLWYTDGDDVWEAIADGAPESFADEAFFDIIKL